MENNSTPSVLGSDNGESHWACYVHDLVSDVIIKWLLLVGGTIGKFRLIFLYFYNILTLCGVFVISGSRLKYRKGCTQKLQNKYIGFDYDCKRLIRC